MRAFLNSKEKTITKYHEKNKYYVAQSPRETGIKSPQKRRRIRLQ